MVQATDLHAAVTALASRRPAFHSEADFQFALAWEIHDLYRDTSVRLEYPVPLQDESGEIDIWLRDASSGPVRETAIELKYWKRKAELTVEGERFSLKERAFKNLYPYDYWKDVVRVEALIADGSASAGYVVALTNDHYYWNADGGGAADRAFRMHEGRAVSGTLSWGPTSNWDKEPLVLRGCYDTHWRNYSVVASEPAGSFRYLLLDVGAGLAAGGT